MLGLGGERDSTMNDQGWRWESRYTIGTHYYEIKCSNQEVYSSMSANWSSALRKKWTNSAVVERCIHQIQSQKHQYVYHIGVIEQHARQIKRQNPQKVGTS